MHDSKPKQPAAPARLLACTILAIVVSGCSTFKRDFKEAAALPQSSDSIAGVWKGSWLSDHNAHTGSLRAIITHKEADTYHARFHATYKRIFSFGQAVDLVVKKDGTNFTFSGSADLGGIYGGNYAYEGKATPENFFSTYKCSIDHGTFQMKRP
ncbi:MAG: hypothetical protein CMO80_23415 [Verrucomicrobiales bacterium]|nr:hypothetical protein [Verrucomicrobiales bacterium]|tara:strand:+ start:647 stop:1108 length:462 start_codon:yes stop_codon:yes gene_type:complete